MSPAKTKTTDPAPEQTTERELERGVILIRDQMYSSPRDPGDGSISLTPPPPRPPGRRERRRRDWGSDPFWRLLLWLFFILISLAIGGLLGEVLGDILRRER
jgi:hypothetical protein